MILVKVLGLGVDPIEINMEEHQTLAEMIIAAGIRGSKILHRGSEVYDYSRTIVDVCGENDPDPEARIFRYALPLGAYGYAIGIIMARNTRLRAYMIDAVLAGKDIQNCMLEFKNNLDLVREIQRSDQEPINVDLLTLEKPEEWCIKWYQNGKIFGMNAETFRAWRHKTPLINPWTNEPLPEPWQTSFRTIHIV